MPARSTLTPQLHKRIVESVRAGNYLRTAAEAAGVREQRMQKWRNQGEEALEKREAGGKLSANEEAFARFFEDVTQARAEAEENRLRDLTECLQDAKSWQRWAGHMTILERSRPEHWKRRDVVEQKPEDPSGALVEELEQLPRAERLKRIAELKARIGEDKTPLKVVA